MTRAPLAALIAAACAAGVVAAAPQARSLHVTFNTWPAATPRAQPRAVTVTTDGAVWYAGERMNALGRLDPASGRVKETPLPPNLGIVGIAADTYLNIWFAGSASGRLGRFDTKSGWTAQYPIPQHAASDLQRIAIDAERVVWFTASEANLVGTIDLRERSPRARVALVPTTDGRPDAITIGPGSTPFFAESRAPKIGAVDPRTMTVREYTLPNTGARPRGIAAAGAVVYYTDYARGVLGRLEPATGKSREFAAPGGPSSKPWAIAIAPDGAVWYCETAVPAKNRLVRFVPETGTVASWQVPGAGPVQQMTFGANGDLWLPLYGAGTIARARVSPARAR